MKELKEILNDIISQKREQLLNALPEKYKTDCGYINNGVGFVSCEDTINSEKLEEDAIEELVADIYSGDFSCFDNADFEEWLVKEIQK